MKDIDNMSYPNETAGRVMTNKIPVVYRNSRVSQVIKELIKHSDEYETINYIYVLTKNDELSGVVSIKELLKSDQNQVVKEIINKDVAKVHGHTDQEKVALIALKNKIKMVPVVNKNNLFLGVVPTDVIFRIMDQESVEDILRFGGVLHSGSIDDVMKLSIWKSLLHRLPWLIIGMCGGLFSAQIIQYFNITLTQSILIAAFIPLVVYIAGAVSIQVQVIIVRDLVLNKKILSSKYFYKQFLIIAFSGFILAFLALMFTYIIYFDLKFSLILGLSIFMATISTIITGQMIPIIFNRLNIDPANASSPIATILQDIVSITVYLSIATIMLVN